MPIFLSFQVIGILSDGLARSVGAKQHINKVKYVFVEPVLVREPSLRQRDESIDVNVNITEEVGITIGRETCSDCIK